MILSPSVTQVANLFEEFTRLAAGSIILEDQKPLSCRLFSARILHKNGQVHDAGQHERELKLPSCKRTVRLLCFPTIAVHTIEDSKSIFLAATFGRYTLF